MSTVYGVIVNWNLWPDTIICIESLLAAGLPLDRVIVVDNASQDHSPVHLRAHFGAALWLLESPENLGFGGGCNLGIAFALERGAKWVLLLNNDTQVAPSFLAELADAVKLGPKYAVFGPLILYQEQPQRIWRLGDRRLFGSLLTYSPYRGAREPGRMPGLLPLDFVTGCAMLVKGDVFRVVGLFDPTIFMYGEDVDLCWRIHLAGFMFAAAPRARMWHKVSSSSNRDRPAARYWRIRNQISFYRTYANHWQFPLLIAATGLRTLWMIAMDWWSGQPLLTGSHVRAWLDGWFKPNRAASKEFEWNR